MLAFVERNKQNTVSDDCKVEGEMLQVKKKSKKTIRKSVGGGGKPILRRTAASGKNTELRVLILEDNLADAELMKRQLKKAGIAFVSRRTATRSDFLQALNSFKPDIILADYSLPKFNALQALALRKKNAPLTPFIIVTGSINEEIAVECMKKGADDYLLKDRPARLGEAVRHSLTNRRLQAEKMEAEESLRDSELLYRTFIDSSTDMAFLKDDRFRHLLANKELCDFLGQAENRIIGKTDFELMDKSAAAKCRKTDKQALAENRIHISEGTINGRTFEIRKFPVKLTNGRIGIGGYIRDISERKRTQDQIEHAKRKWTITFDAIKDGIALLAVDQTIRQVNRAFANLVKKPFPEIIGKKCYELMHSDRQPDQHCPFAKMLKSKKRESIELAVADRVFEMLVDPITNDAGNISGAAHIMSDITERKRVEGALRESEEQYRDLIEKGNIAIVIDDIDGNLIYFNNKFLNLFGYSAGEIKGKTHKEFIHPDSFEIISKYHEKRMQGEKIPSRYEFKGIRKDGSRINVEIDVCEIIKKEGKASGTRSYMWDITERKKTEDALIDSENRYRNHFESSSEFYFTLDLKGNFIDVNQAAVALTGYAKSELLKMNFKDYTPKRDHRKLFLTLSNIYKTGKPVQNILVEATIKNKSKKYFETSISLMKKGEQIIGFHGSSKDITERKRAEEALRGSEQKYRTMIEQSNDMIWTLDTEGNLTFFNRRSEEISGHRFADWRGKSFVPLIVEEDLPLVADVFRRTLNGESQHYEVRVKKKDGDIFTLSVNTAPILEAGKVVGTVSFGRDITERKQAEEALQQSEKDYRNLFDNATDAIYIQDKKGRFLDVNQGAVDMYGYPKEFFIGKTPAFLSAPGKNDMKKIIGFVEDAFNGKPRQYDFWGIRKNGEVFPKFVRSQQGFYLGQKSIVTSAIDITERKRAEEQIKDSLKEKEVLLKEIHHRVKNNLQVISGLLTLQAEHIGDERLQGMLKESQSRIWTMALIHQTLYQSGNLADIDMADYIRSLVGNLLSSHARVAMPPTINFDLLPLRLVIDKAIPLALIINELVSNAMKHAFPDGRPGEIRISLQERTGTARRAPTDQKHAPTYELTVADNGVGLPAGFDLKNQKSLGLQLVTMLTKQLGGSLAIESSGGTSVHIIFSNNEKNEK